MKKSRDIARLRNSYMDNLGHNETSRLIWIWACITGNVPLLSTSFSKNQFIRSNATFRTIEGDDVEHIMGFIGKLAMAREME